RQVADLVEAEATGVGGAEQHADHAAAEGVEEAGDLLGGADGGQFARPLAVGQARHNAVPRTGYPIKEAQGGDGLVVGGPGGLLVVQEVEDVTVGLVEAKLVGGLPEVAGELAEVVDVDLDGPGGAIAELEILDEA